MATRGVIVLGVVLAAATAQAYRVDEIPDPRPRGWVTDLTRTLAPADREALEAACAEVAAAGEGELAVAVVDTIGGADPRTFATGVFNHWQLGRAGRDDGILIFAALDDHAAEIILGDGVDDDAQVAISEGIMQEEMVPRFREGDAARALLAGARACRARILAAPRGGASPSSSPSPEPEPFQSARYSDDTSRESSVTDDPVVLGGGGVLGLLGLLGGGRFLLRRRPRKCPSCRMPMQRLDEAADDAHLEQAEKVEERIGSVDYDVWGCSSCGEITKLRYGAIFTRYSSCPQCFSRTKSSHSSTIRSATYSSGGLIEVTETCANCSYQNQYQRSTPRLQRSSSGSSFSSRGGGGGGHSSGRGASGRW